MEAGQYFGNIKHAKGLKVSKGNFTKGFVKITEIEVKRPRHQSSEFSARLPTYNI
jgi:hypothetical protein